MREPDVDDMRAFAKKGKVFVDQEREREREGEGGSADINKNHSHDHGVQKVIIQFL